MNIQSILTAAPDYAAIKAKQNAAWSAGEYAKVGTTLQITGEELAETMDLEIDSSVLDVAAGNGNATLAFARRFQNVTSTDYVAPLLEASKARALAEGLSVTYKVADAEDLPFEDRSFSAAISSVLPSSIEIFAETPPFLFETSVIFALVRMRIPAFSKRF